jgi:predicted acetyltransferase
MEFDTGEPRKNGLQRERHAPQPAAIRLVTGNVGDHKPVYALLRAANRAPAYESFLAWLDEPSYEPLNRLLVKRDSQLLAHVQVLDRVAWFHGAKIPVGGVDELVTLPEFRTAGYERLLLSTAEQTLRSRRAVVALAGTDQPHVFRGAGWSEAIGQGHTEANVNDVLARLAQKPAEIPTVRRTRPLRIRLWRQVELDTLRHVYRQAMPATWGAIDRSEAYWRWLVNRRAYDELIVAIHGPDDWDVLSAPAHIVGYAITRGSRVVELATLRAFGRAAEPLLARACQDAIERDHRTLSLHLPSNDPLHDVLLAAGGTWSTGGRNCRTRLGGILMLKLLDPVRWIDGLQAVLAERATAAGIDLPLNIVFSTGQRRYRLELTQGSGQLVRQKAAPADVSCSPEMLGDLLLGNVDVVAVWHAGGVAIEKEDTAWQLAALFPRIPLWQSQFDTLRF